MQRRQAIRPSKRVRRTWNAKRRRRKKVVARYVKPKSRVKKVVTISNSSEAPAKAKIILEERTILRDSSLEGFSKKLSLALPYNMKAFCVMQVLPLEEEKKEEDEEETTEMEEYEETIGGGSSTVRQQPQPQADTGYIKLTAFYKSQDLETTVAKGYSTEEDFFDALNAIEEETCVIALQPVCLPVYYDDSNGLLTATFLVKGPIPQTMLFGKAILYYRLEAEFYLPRNTETLVYLSSVRHTDGEAENNALGQLAVLQAKDDESATGYIKLTRSRRRMRKRIAITYRRGTRGRGRRNRSTTSRTISYSAPRSTTFRVYKPMPEVYQSLLAIPKWHTQIISTMHPGGDVVPQNSSSRDTGGTPFLVESKGEGGENPSTTKMLSWVADTKLWISKIEFFSSTACAPGVTLTDMNTLLCNIFLTRIAYGNTLLARIDPRSYGCAFSSLGSERSVYEKIRIAKGSRLVLDVGEMLTLEIGNSSEIMTSSTPGGGGDDLLEGVAFGATLRITFAVVPSGLTVDLLEQAELSALSMEEEERQEEQGGSVGVSPPSSFPFGTISTPSSSTTSGGGGNVLTREEETEEGEIDFV